MYYITQPTVSTIVQSINYVIVCLILFAIIIGTALMSVQLSNASDGIFKDPKLECHTHITTLLPITTDRNKLLAVNFYPIFLFKRLLFCITLISLYNYPLIQLVCFGVQSIVVIQLLSFLYICI